MERTGYSPPSAQGMSYSDSSISSGIPITPSRAGTSALAAPAVYIEPLAGKEVILDSDSSFSSSAKSHNAATTAGSNNNPNCDTLLALPSGPLTGRLSGSETRSVTRKRTATGVGEAGGKPEAIIQSALRTHPAGHKESKPLKRRNRSRSNEGIRVPSRTGTVSANSSRPSSGSRSQTPLSNQVGSASDRQRTGTASGQRRVGIGSAAG